jgi:hypothetical protein
MSNTISVGRSNRFSFDREWLDVPVEYIGTYENKGGIWWRKIQMRPDKIKYQEVKLEDFLAEIAKFTAELLLCGVELEHDWQQDSCDYDLVISGWRIATDEEVEWVNRQVAINKQASERDNATRVAHAKKILREAGEL